MNNNRNQIAANDEKDGSGKLRDHQITVRATPENLKESRGKARKTPEILGDKLGELLTTCEHYQRFSEDVRASLENLREPLVQSQRILGKEGRKQNITNNILSFERNFVGETLRQNLEEPGGPVQRLGPAISSCKSRRFSHKPSIRKTRTATLKR